MFKHAEIRLIREIRGQEYPLLAALMNPGTMLGHSGPELSTILAQARATKLLHRLAVRASDSGVLDQLADPLRATLSAAVDEWHVRNQRARWELDYTLKSLSVLDGPITLLKGTAYRVLDLPCARGRMYNDLDILVHPDQLAAAETALYAGGWEMTELLPHQEAYFRRWMHELPTFVHNEHGIKVDLHHNILPRIDRIRIDPKSLIAASVEVPGMPRVRVLSPEDLILHSATHLFRRGEFANGLRDLLDIHEMSARWRGEMPDFDSRLNSRARALHLTRPLSQALYYSALLFGPATPEVRAQESASETQNPELGTQNPILRPPSSVFRHIYLRALLPPRIDHYDHARDRIHYVLQHYPPDLWRKSIRPKLERVFGNKGAILPRSTSPSAPI